MPAMVCVESDFGLIRMPLELHRKLLGSVPVGEVDVVVLVVGGGVGERVVVVVVTGGVVETEPVQVVPFSAKLAGTGFEELFQEPLNPKLAVPPVGMLPL
jgi:hypothetical protein